MIYKLANKPWEMLPILVRAKRFRKLRTRLEDQEHIQWAESLVIPSKRWNFDPIDGFPYPPV